MNYGLCNFVCIQSSIFLSILYFLAIFGPIIIETWFVIMIFFSKMECARAGLHTTINSLPSTLAVDLSSEVCVIIQTYTVMQI